MSADCNPSTDRSPRQAPTHDLPGPISFLSQGRGGSVWALTPSPNHGSPAQPDKYTSPPSQPTEMTAWGQPNRFVCPSIITCDGRTPMARPVPQSQVENVFVPRTQGEVGLQGLFWVMVLLGQTGWCSPLEPTEHAPVEGPDAWSQTPHTQASQSALPPASQGSPGAFSCASSPQVPVDSCCPALQLLHPPATQVLRGRG